MLVAVSLYTGDDHSGLDRFKKKQVQVLIASRPISTGVDGLQHICNNLIINTLPWTNADYQQLVGRLVRKGSKMDSVNIYIIKANINGFPYDDNKWKRIQYKRTLADCAVDGRLPEKNMVTPRQAMMEAVRWLERLERSEISRINRRDLDVRLTPVEIEKHQINLSEFSKLNSVINNSKSENIHERIKQDPQFLIQYHERLDEARKFWSVEPLNVIADKINGLKIPAQIIMKMVIGDFGCGRARLAELLKENKMYNFDHHDILNDKIISCDMKKTQLKNESLDIAVFCLSLMGENWPDYVKEAKRCLRRNGMLMIAETTKSLGARVVQSER